jgi:putative oxidoreductase
MIFQDLISHIEWPLLLLRIITGIVFLSSGWSHATKPAERSESIGMSKAFTFVLGLAEITGAIGIIFGIFSQIAALLLIGVMLGAISKKIFVWKTGFYAEKGYGWHYDLLLLAANLVILFTAGGSLTLF